MEIWEPKPAGTLWATPGLLRDSFTFTLPIDNNKLGFRMHFLRGTKTQQPRGPLICTAQIRAIDFVGGQTPGPTNNQTGLAFAIREQRNRNVLYLIIKLVEDGGKTPFALSITLQFKICNYHSGDVSSKQSATNPSNATTFTFP